MSNFICPYCGRAIVEGENGDYITNCEHYPFEGLDAEILNRWCKEAQVKRNWPDFVKPKGEEG